MSFSALKSLCLVVESQSSHQHLFCAKQPDKARSVIAVKTPLKNTAIDKYFIQENDLISIKESLVEKPTVFEFDQVFRSSS